MKLWIYHITEMNRISWDSWGWFPARDSPSTHSSGSWSSAMFPQPALMAPWWGPCVMFSRKHSLDFLSFWKSRLSSVSFFYILFSSNGLWLFCFPHFLVYSSLPFSGYHIFVCLFLFSGFQSLFFSIVLNFWFMESPIAREIQLKVLCLLNASKS